MPISSTFYGTVVEANDYFTKKLHTRAWDQASVAQRPNALLEATRIIDVLNYKGDKHTVHVLLSDNPDATDEEIRAAELTQGLEFPRGEDVDVPESIRIACYEIAYSLLDGVDPQAELENLGVSSFGYSSVRTTFNRTLVPVEHLVNGVPSYPAWRLLKPFLRESREVKTSRVS